MFQKRFNKGARDVLVTKAAYKLFRTSFTSTVKPTAHTNPSRKWSFSEPLFTREEPENAGLSFSCGRNHFSIRTWRKLWRRNSQVIIFLTEVSSNTTPKRPVTVAFWDLLQFLRLCGNNLICFQSETFIFIFPRRSVYGPKGYRNYSLIALTPHKYNL